MVGQRVLRRPPKSRRCGNVPWKGVIYSTSTRQKLNTKSSTEVELDGVIDFLPQVLWTRYFLEAQGYGIADKYCVPGQ